MRAAAASRLTVLLSVALAAAVSVNAAGAKPAPKFDGPTIEHPSLAPDFTLHDQHEQSIRLSAQRGKVVLITFLYTHCPDLCPLTATHLNTALGSLGARRNDVVVLAVSVDPKGDTPAAVQSFVRAHRLRPQFHYLTGSRQELAPVWRAYQVASVRHAGDDVDHTLYTLVLDRTLKTRVLFDSTAKPGAIVHDVGILLG